MLSAFPNPNILPDKAVGQRSLDPQDIFFTRYLPPWMRPRTLNGDQWRAWVFNEPVCMICRETLIMQLLSLDWTIEPVDSEKRDELQGVIKYYTKLIEQGGYYYGMDYSGLVEWIAAEVLDLPFGHASEIGRKNDSPNGRVQWIKPLDGATLYPTLNHEFPIVQYFMTYRPVAFPWWSISRVFMSPRPELLREGWGLAPPEKIYFAMEMLSRGDKYYANLLLDIPPAGILDLGDMDQDTALTWVESYRKYMLGGALDSFRVPVLYEHTTKPEFIKFGLNPDAIMYDRITLKYAAIVAAAYGLDLSAIGLQGTGGQETLAGSIRSERKIKNTGLARLKQKVTAWFNNWLPTDIIKFKLIDYDTEQMLGMGRARLANATAYQIYQQIGAFNAQEIRAQSIQDGMFTISIQEKLPKGLKPALPAGGKTNERPGALGSPVNPSQGGEGEVHVKSVLLEKSRYTDSHIRQLVGSIVEKTAPLLDKILDGFGEDEVILIKDELDKFIYNDQDAIGPILQDVWSRKSWLNLDFSGLEKEVSAFAESQHLSETDVPKLTHELQKNIEGGVKELIGKSAIYYLNHAMLNKSQFDDGEELSDNLVVNVSNSVLRDLDEIVSVATNTVFDKFMEDKLE